MYVYINNIASYTVVTWDNFEVGELWAVVKFLLDDNYKNLFSKKCEIF